MTSRSPVRSLTALVLTLGALALACSGSPGETRPAVDRAIRRPAPPPSGGFAADR